MIACPILAQIYGLNPDCETYERTLGVQDPVVLEELEMLKASSVWEDVVYNLTREVKTLRVEGEEEEHRSGL